MRCFACNSQHGIFYDEKIDRYYCGECVLSINSTFRETFDLLSDEGDDILFVSIDDRRTDDDV